MLNTYIKDSLEEIVGRKNFTDQVMDLISYSYDASDHEHRPIAAVWPVNTEQVSRILCLANDSGIPVVPRGAGTGVAGAAVPIKGGIVLDLCRMNKILEIRIEDRLVVVQPGVVYADLERSLTPHGFFYPPDPASSKVCTLGGNAATNAGGLKGAKYGVTRDYVLGLEVVLPDGRILRTGSRCIKSVSGYDLTRLFVGSEGTLGVITEITLKISPRPLSSKTALACFSSLEDASMAIRDIVRSGIIPSVLELMDERTIRVLRENSPLQIPDVKAMILVETDGFTETEASFQMDRVVNVFNSNHVTQVRAARSKGEAEDLWKSRRLISGVAATLSTHNVSEDVTVPISRLTELLTEISGIVSRYKLPFVIFGHAGDGNLHPKIMYNRSDPDQCRRVKKAVEEIFKITCKMGGTLTGEHGIGLAKAPYMAVEHEKVALDVMRSLKRMFDPNNIMNPGKMSLDE